MVPQSSSKPPKTKPVPNLPEAVIQDMPKRKISKYRSIDEPWE
jgi:hypothetical protein